MDFSFSKKRVKKQNLTVVFELFHIKQFDMFVNIQLGSEQALYV